ncbi:MAG: helix-turn-helix domain-containing protein, partial [Acetatifactor sp.]|nr:helix-turn-helix domain-containing protein [Acetatifactor sp.]
MEYSRIFMGKRICSLRAAKGMTQEQLAEVLCVSPAAVSKWERNLAVPNVEMLWMLADYFDCTIDELVGRRQQQLERVGVYD